MKNKIMGVNNFFDRYNHITFFKGKMLSISNFLFKPRMHTGCRQDYPTSSLVMREMTQYKIIEKRLWYSKLFSNSHFK